MRLLFKQKFVRVGEEPWRAGKTYDVPDALVDALVKGGIATIVADASGASSVKMIKPLAASIDTATTTRNVKP